MKVGKNIAITVDDREPARVLAAVRAIAEFDVSVARLPVGDYRVDGRFLFERKTLPDLVASIRSGRLFAQALRLVEAANVQTALILEGTGRDLKNCGMKREAIQGALVMLSLFIGLPVLRTRSPAETARLLLYAARQGRAVAHGALPRRGRRPRGKAALQSYLLQGLPGVGPARADRLLRHFGSVEAVFTADGHSLTAVRGIGRGTARRLRWAVEEEAAVYRVHKTLPAADSFRPRHCH